MKNKDVLLEDFESRKFDQINEIKGGGDGVPWYKKLWYGTTSECTDYNYGDCTTYTSTDYGSQNIETSTDIIH